MYPRRQLRDPLVGTPPIHEIAGVKQKMIWEYLRQKTSDRHTCAPAMGDL